MSQFWKENSIAIDHEDDIIYIQAAPSVVPNKEKVRLRITDCNLKNTKVHIDRTLSLKEAENLLAMLQDAVDHARKMEDLMKQKPED